MMRKNCVLVYGMPRTGHIRICKLHVEKAISDGILPQDYRRYINDLCEGAVRGRDIESFPSIKDWIEWLAWSSVVLNEKDYLTAAVHALELAPRLPGTDYGTSRQRDLGQLWTDAIRGFLGEIAFVKWLDLRFDIKAELDYRKGPLEEFLPSDIKSVNARPPKLKISIKTTKLRGIWLDIPYAQIGHSDLFVLVRVGITKEHFIAFLKKISVIRDKILSKAVEYGIITEEDIENIWNIVPEFRNIPAYIAGFFDKRELGKRIEQTESIFLVEGRIGRKNVTINRYVGFWNPKDDKYKKKVIELLRKKHPNLSTSAGIKFEGIEDFSKTLHFIVSSGVLRRKKEDWKMIVKQI